jgi:hypothetical protein
VDQIEYTIGSLIEFELPLPRAPIAADELRPEEVIHAWLRSRFVTIQNLRLIWTLSRGTRESRRAKLSIFTAGLSIASAV